MLNILKLCIILSSVVAAGCCIPDAQQKSQTGRHPYMLKPIAQAPADGELSQQCCKDKMMQNNTDEMEKASCKQTCR